MYLLLCFKGYKPALPAEPVPHTEDFALCDAFGWNEDDCRNVSRGFKDAMLLHLEARAAHRKSNE